VGAEPSFRRLPRAVREQQMLDAAVVVFSRRGYHGAGVDEIAEAAGISKPMVYAYLGTKEELFIACLYREGARLMEGLVAATLADDLTPDEQLRRGLRAFFAFVGTHRDGWIVLYQQARGQERFAGVLAQMRQRLVEIVSGMLARAAGPGVRDDDVTTSGYAVVGAAEALAEWVVNHPDEDHDRLAARLTNVIWLGIGSVVDPR
jgi:AcrR family transcriptional regulator